MPIMIRGSDGRLYDLSSGTAVPANQTGLSEPQAIVRSDAGADDHLSGNFESLPG